MSGQDHDKILDHHRLQLSALMDGELPAEEARFLLRRLEHDGELAGCWERWQLCGDVLRGRAGALLPVDVAPRVAAAVASEARHAAPGGARWMRWGGGAAALAASVAAVALLLGRQAPGPAPQSPAPLASAQVPATAPVKTPAPTDPGAPGQASQLAAAVAVAEVPRRAVARRVRAQRATRSVPVRAEAAVATSIGAGPELAAIDPFSPHQATIRTKPWPRALLPESAAAGAFTVDYGTVNAGSSSFYPFEPQPAPLPEAADARRP